MLKTAPLAAPGEWLHELARLKDWVEKDTQFQQVGRKTYFEVNGADLRLMIEVVGVPRNLEQKALTLMDLEAADILVYDFKDADLFSIDLETILASAGRIQAALGKGENRLHEIFHLVLDEEKIALHFFRQKDYSQNLLS